MFRKFLFEIFKKVMKFLKYFKTLINIVHELFQAKKIVIFLKTGVSVGNRGIEAE